MNCPCFLHLCDCVPPCPCLFWVSPKCCVVVQWLFIMSFFPPIGADTSNNTDALNLQQSDAFHHRATAYACLCRSSPWSCSACLKYSTPLGCTRVASEVILSIMPRLLAVVVPRGSQPVVVSVLLPVCGVPFHTACVALGPQPSHPVSYVSLHLLSFTVITPTTPTYTLSFRQLFWYFNNRTE